ncbi:peptidoglycan-binding domain-containing protein, partial [Streptomyces sp. WM6386]|uniref:peptidoglycan-binding domain-containing protein n=1 Tax=Streptomyces sp. WM6386 TaxID=1415558 RepID=UPI000619E071
YPCHSPSPSRSTDPTASPTTSATASDTADDSSDARESTPPVLRRGSEGDEVSELELRLTQLGLYTRKASGHYNEGVEDAVSRYQWARGIQTAEYGVYDLATRERLESETQEP